MSLSPFNALLHSGFPWEGLLSEDFTWLHSGLPSISRGIPAEADYAPTADVVTTPAIFHGPPTPWDPWILQKSFVQSHSWATTLPGPGLR